ncbi:MAG TPA: PQQ-binding-like beta-propeller repeat protein [Nitrososphaerales archaeon]|nr:PQQ-binding-like beta-propeller repeat protein [Nitrososphaerales archaeon]
MKKAVTALFSALLLLSVAATAPGYSQTPQFANWTGPAYDVGNTNNDPQAVINSGNVQNLQIQWIYQVQVNPYSIPGAAPSLGIETTPLVVGGYVFFATPYNRLIALNAANGHELWHLQVNMSSFVKDPWWSEAYTISSISYYNGTVYMMASDTSVYAVNAFSGEVEFVINNTAANIPGNTGTYFGEKAPLLYKNELIVRASTTDYGGRGYVAAYDVNSKALLWRWYSVPPAGGSANWDANASLGNVQSYQGDWGSNTLMGGGAAWGLMTVDNQTGLLYFSVGHPSGPYDAAQRPGPNLYTDSVVALDSATGKMAWYYQYTSHDLAEHEGGWSITLANINVNGQLKKVVIQAAKNNYIYVLDASTGKPVYDPFPVGSPNSNNLNDNQVASANLTGSQAQMVGKRICPGPDGGIEMNPALDGSNLFVASQNACGLMFQGPVTYKGQTFQGYVYQGDPTAPQNSTLYSVNLSTRTVNWAFQMPDRYQGSSAVVSGGVVYVVDRQGTLYLLNEQNGQLIRSWQLNGLGASGVSIGEDSAGDMMVFAPAGGGDIPSPTAGVVVGFGLTASGGSASGFAPTLYEGAAIGFGVAVVVLGFFYLFRRSRTRSAGKSPMAPPV